MDFWIGNWSDLGKHSEGTGRKSHTGSIPEQMTTVSSRGCVTGNPLRKQTDVFQNCLYEQWEAADLSHPHPAEVCPGKVNYPTVLDLG